MNDKIFDIHDMGEEPWVYIPDDKDLQGWSSKQSVIFNQRNRHRQKYQFYVNVFDF